MTPAPRVVESDLEAAIASEHYFTADEGVAGAAIADQQPYPVSAPVELAFVTICVLVLHNGHKVLGVNYGPVSGEHFSRELGRELARRDARNKLWELLGYALRDRLHAGAAG